MIACLRSLGLPARYVSGYLAGRRENNCGAEASHAWASLYCPAFGWLDFDPTNDVMPNGGHVTIAWGRDYSDVTPSKAWRWAAASRLSTSVCRSCRYRRRWSRVWKNWNLRAVVVSVASSTLHKNWLPSLIFSPSGRDKSEGAGCGSPFFRSLLGQVMAASRSGIRAVTPSYAASASRHLSRVDPVMARIIKETGPYRVRVSRRRFQALARTIMFQQLAGRAAAAILNARFVALFPGLASPPRRRCWNAPTRICARPECRARRPCTCATSRRMWPTSCSTSTASAGCPTMRSSVI